MMKTDETFVTIEDFMAILHVSRSTIDRLRKRRPAGFPSEFQAVSRRPLFKRQEVLAWVESQPLW